MNPKSIRKSETLKWSQPPTPTQQYQRGSHSELIDDYGVASLLGDPETEPFTPLSLGIDLKTLGLDLNTREKQYPYFDSPWGLRTEQPEAYTPLSYFEKTTELPQDHVGLWKLETLFYAFHNVPQDFLQAHAAQELNSRGWRYNAQEMRWYYRSNGIWVYFDPDAWCRNECAQDPDEDEFLPDEAFTLNLDGEEE